MSNTFTFNGTASSVYGVTIEKCPSYPVANRVVEHIQVPGRNGDLIRDTGAYNNVEQVYSIWFDGRSSSMQDAARNVALWLNGSHGYCRLEDTYDPNVYRMAVMSNYTEYRNFRNKLGRADVTFSCKPQRFLKSGETLTLVNGSTLANPYMDCYPILAVTGNGQVIVDNQILTVSNNAGDTIYIDTETGDCWSGSATYNANVPLPYIILSPSSPSASIDIPFSVAEAPYLYFTYTYVATGFTRTLSINRASLFTTSDNITGGTVTITVYPNGSKIFFSFSGTSTNQISSSISTALNRNSDVTGQFAVVKHGGATVSHTATSLSWVPRWWTL